MKLISKNEAMLKYWKWLWSSFPPKTASQKEKKKQKKEKEKKPATLKKKNPIQKYSYKHAMTKTQFGFTEPKAYLKLCWAQNWH